MPSVLANSDENLLSMRIGSQTDGSLPLNPKQRKT
jgi:hypothetical protein